mmetsp:Transcript_32798/g.49441  ORF Transcript_32798/g.49441 Transcript_32798/m.49441 type:complete len:527 (-) Transcript_32798:2568-4148(-)
MMLLHIEKMRKPKMIFPLIFIWFLALVDCPAVLGFQIQPCAGIYSRKISPSAMKMTATEAIDDFCEKVQASIDSGDFESINFQGPSKKAAQKELLRGCIWQVNGRLVKLIKKKGNKVQVHLTFKYHGATDICKNWQIEDTSRLLKELLSATKENAQYKSEWGTFHPCGSPLGLSFCSLKTCHNITKLNLITSKINTMKLQSNEATKDDLVTAHDRIKQVPVSQQASFWNALGLSKKPSKRRQCQKFVEIVGNLVKQMPTMKSSKVKSIQTIDMGCGRGYLTFSLHHHLRENYPSSISIDTRGIDMRPKLVAEMNKIVESLREANETNNMNGLMFETGTIESFLRRSRNYVGYSKSSKVKEQLKILIALHACDVATDDALWSGIQMQADIIVVAPCCHKEIRPQLDAHFKKNKDCDPLRDVLRYGIYRERIAETITDSIRALLLELAGYQVNVFEFIGGEHTGKNVMITGTRRTTQRSKSERDSIRHRLQKLTEMYGIKSQKLVAWTNHDSKVSEKNGVSAKTMPPL